MTAGTTKDLTNTVGRRERGMGSHYRERRNAKRHRLEESHTNEHE
jgi:hypothetical protein